MKCRQTRRLFSRHLDNRIGEGERRAFDEHLAGCGACREELVRWEVPSRALRAMAAAEAPEGLVERSWRAAMTASSAPPSFEQGFVWAARRAAVVGVAAAALMWGGLLWQEPEAASGEGAAELSPDVAEMAMSLWAAEPAAETTPDGLFEGAEAE
jgi:anti-sigma factor RsiW